MYKPLKEMTYQKNKPVIVLTNVAKINPKEATLQHSAFQSLLSILNTGCVPWFYTLWYKRGLNLFSAVEKYFLQS